MSRDLLRAPRAVDRSPSRRLPPEGRLTIAAERGAAGRVAAAVVPFPLARAGLIAAAVCAIVNVLLGANPYLNMDSHAFEAIARSLLAGRGFVYEEPMLHGLPFLAFRSPGYSTFLALELFVGGVTGAIAIQGALQ